jgi:hypothetical protein
MTGVQDDVLGFSHEARAGDGGKKPVCLDLMVALVDEMEAEGNTGGLMDLRARYYAVLNGERLCPLAASCGRLRRALERGARLVSPGPIQLMFAGFAPPNPGEKPRTAKRPPRDSSRGKGA